MCGVWCGVHHGASSPIPAHFGAYMPDTPASTPPSPTAGASAQKQKTKQIPGSDAQQRSRVPPTPAFLGWGPIDFWLPLALFLVPLRFSSLACDLCSCLSSRFPLRTWFASRSFDDPKPLNLYIRSVTIFRATNIKIC